LVETPGLVGKFDGYPGGSEACLFTEGNAG
jgi:hypothetical protein